MTDNNARLKLPLFAAADYKEETEKAERLRAELRHEMQDRVDKMKKRYGLALIVLFIWAASMMVGCCLTGWIVKNNTNRKAKEETESAVKSAVNSERNYIFSVLGITDEQFQAAEKTKDEEPAILTGQASYEKALERIEVPLAKHVASLRQIRKCTKAGAETYAWVDIAILKSGKYGDDLTDFLSDPTKIEGYSEDVNVRQEDTEIAHKVAEMETNQQFPNGFSTDYQYAVINPDGSVTARTDLVVKSTTRFWEAEG